MGQLDHKDEKLTEAMGLQDGYPPFMKLLGVTYEPLDGGSIAIRVVMRDELRQAPGGPLHGGVVASLMDVIGGIVVALELRKGIEDLPLEEQARKMKSVSTIDLRVDYLRPAKGQDFTAMGSLLRSGRKLAVARMELRNEEDLLIAVGTGTYTTA
jgi:uncharacterized protein (TIGR00369 family)